MATNGRALNHMDGVLKDGFEFRDFFDKHTGISKTLVIKPAIIANAANYIKANKILIYHKISY